MIKIVSLMLVSLLAVSSAWAEGFTLSSPTVSGQLGISEVYNGFGCTGKNVSPELSWSEAPKGTKSYALTMYDPDAPTGSGWWHWIVFNIDSKTLSLKAGAGNVKNKTAPKGSVQSVTDYKTSGFGGACPPVGHGAHQYIFTVYALDTEKLSLDESANPALVGYMINSHTLAKSSLVAYYGR